LTCRATRSAAASLGQQAIGVDQLEAAGRLQRVPLVHIAVDQDGPFIVVGRDPPVSAGQGVIDGAFGARAA